MERLGDIVERTVKRLPLSRRLEDYAVWTVWDYTVGPAVARNARPEKLRNGTLIVRVRAAAWMQQLHYMKDIMLEKLNRELGREVITNIFFVVGEVNAEPPREDPRRIPSSLRPWMRRASRSGRWTASTIRIFGIPCAACSWTTSRNGVDPFPLVGATGGRPCGGYHARKTTGSKLPRA